MFKGAIVLIGNEDGVGSNNKRFIHADKFSIQAKKRIITADGCVPTAHSKIWLYACPCLRCVFRLRPTNACVICASMC